MSIDTTLLLQDINHLQYLTSAVSTMAFPREGPLVTLVLDQRPDPVTQADPSHASPVYGPAPSTTHMYKSMSSSLASLVYWLSLSRSSPLTVSSSPKFSVGPEIY